MSDETNVTTALPQPESQESHRWVKCKGCGGEIGIPANWEDETVECPECREQVRVHGKVLYRKPADQKAPEPAFVQVVAPSIKKTPSLELEKEADSALTFGILSIFLGWTFIVPFIGLCQYLGASSMADKEKVRVPTKATTGLILSIVFGACQGLAVISHLCK